MESRVLSRLLIVLLVVSQACNSLSPGSRASATARPMATVSPAETTALNETAVPEPSATPTAAVLDLEIVEWFEHAIPNLVDPSIKDTKVEILVRNPNDFPVYVNTDELEFRLLDAAGEVVYTNGSPYFSLWTGSWMLAGESTGFQICACFQTSGLETKEWESIKLVAPVQRATDLVYTTDVEATLGEPFSLAEAHLGGGGTGIPITLTNTSDQPLENIPMRIIARDAGGRYIGMAGFGNSVVSFTEKISIPPGDSLQGVIDSEIDYFDKPLTYEVAAIGIPARAAAATEEFVWPTGGSTAEWRGIPIMPDAMAGGINDDAITFTVREDHDEIVRFYETELTDRGFELKLTVDDQNAGGATTLTFGREGTTGLIWIAQYGDGIYQVIIRINK